MSIVVRLALVSLIPIASMHAETSAQQFVARPSVTLARPEATADIVDTAIASKCTTLARALEAAGLVEALKAAGPFTLFAPTDEAFAALPKGTLESLLLPENKEKLRDILMHHVVPGRLISYEVGNIDVPQMARTISGDRESIGADGGGFRFGDARVIGADARCTNGLVHVIDRVVLPRELRSEERMKMAMKEAAPASLLAALRAVPDGRFSTFIAAVEASGGDQDWAQPEPQGNWTLFIPTNDAFARLTDAERATLLDPKNRDALRAVLDWHALPKLQTWGFDFNDGERGPAMVSENNDRFVLDILANGSVFVYRLRSRGVERAAEEPFKARIIAGDIAVGGTVVHVVDRVIIPPQLENRVIASQAYLEKDVKDSAMGAYAQYRIRYEFKEMMSSAEQLDDAGAVALYRFGLRLLEDVLPVSRSGVMITRDMNSDRRDVLRDRLRARIDDLDRVWYAMFMKNSPAATTLDAPIPGDGIARRAGNPADTPAPKVMLRATTEQAPERTADVVVRAAASAPAAPSAAPSAAPPATPTWCEILEKDVDATVVTDPALRDAIAKTGLPWRVRDKASGIEMLLVPPGQFSMGKSQGDAEAMSNEVPAHPVTLTGAYYLGRFEVTQAQWKKVMGDEVRERREPATAGTGAVQIGGAGGAVFVVQPRVELQDQDGNPIGTSITAETDSSGTVTFTTTAIDPGRSAEAADARPELPVYAAWPQSAAFCARLGMRLPTEAEWEYACRAGVQAGRYGPLDEIAWHRGNARGRRQPVGLKAANALGFHDMIGNAWEWVNDWYGEYSRGAQTNPMGPSSGDSRIARGSYFNYEGGFCRSSQRYEMQSPDFAGAMGFRVARNP